MNLCTACGEDFGSVSAFDAHRVGKHGYSFKEGLEMDPPRDDGRRCLDTDELAELGYKRDRLNRWRAPISEKALLRLRESRSRHDSPSPEVPA